MMCVCLYFSKTRWWSSYEQMEQIIRHFSQIQKMINKAIELDICPANAEYIRDAMDNPKLLLLLVGMILLIEIQLYEYFCYSRFFNILPTVSYIPCLHTYRIIVSFKYSVLLLCILFAFVFVFLCLHYLIF